MTTVDQVVTCPDCKTAQPGERLVGDDGRRGVTCYRCGYSFVVKWVVRVVLSYFQETLTEINPE